MTGRLKPLDVALLNASRRTGGLFFFWQRAFLFILTAHARDAGVREASCSHKSSGFARAAGGAAPGRVSVTRFCQDCFMTRPNLRPVSF